MTTNDLTVSIPATLPIPVPPGVTRASFLRRAFQAGLKHLADTDRLPPLPADGTIRIKLTLPPGAIAQLDALVDQTGTNVSVAFHAALIRGFQQIADDTTTARVEISSECRPNLAELPFQAKSPEQTACWRAVQPALFEKKIVMVEASTSTGKGRVLALAAARAALENLGPVWLVTSTVKLVFDLYQEFHELPAPARQGVTATILPGRTEFVSASKLAECLDAYAEISPKAGAEVRGWMAAGAPAHLESALAKSIRGVGLAPAWLVADLRAIAPDFPVDEVRLTSNQRTAGGEEDIAEQFTKALRASLGEEADVVICTHHMLSALSRSGWTGSMPNPKFLIADEAHLLEQTVSNMNSSQLSFLSLSLAIRAAMQGMPNSTALKGAIKSVANLKALALSVDLHADARPDGAVSINSLGTRDRALLIQSLQSLVAGLKSRSLKDYDDLRTYRERVQGILNLLDQTSVDRRLGGSEVRLSWSPDKRFASLITGPRSVGPQMGFLWKMSENGGIAASATLYVRSETGAYRCDYMRSLLAIPVTRLITPPPIIMKHITRTPIMHIPGRGLVQKGIMTPPNLSDTPEAEALWNNEVAQRLEKITGQAVGGTLVLCTSYRQVAALTERLLAKESMSSRIVAASPKVPFALIEMEFRAKAAAELRPVMLGLGSAWTGIDLSDKLCPAEQDVLLTDLVITRMPIGLNRSMSMMVRRETTGLHSLIQECLMYLKQGLGRLVRREGLKDRHIWVLDTRIWANQGFGLPALARSAARMLADYKQGAPIE